MRMTSTEFEPEGLGVENGQNVAGTQARTVSLMANRVLLVVPEYKGLYQVLRGHWVVLKTAIPQKNLPNTTILQYRVKTRCHTETATLYITFRANNTEQKLRFGNVRFRQNK